MARHFVDSHRALGSVRLRRIRHTLVSIAQIITYSLRRGGRLYLAGNGGNHDPTSGLLLHRGVYNLVVRDFCEGKPLAVTISNIAKELLLSDIGRSLRWKVPTSYSLTTNAWLLKAKVSASLQLVRGGRKPATP